MATITISNRPVGKSLIYEKRGRQGRLKLVTAFDASVEDERSGRRFDFAVTRDSSEVVFNGREPHYGASGECPPNRTFKPYHGRVRIDANVGWCIQLFERDCPAQESLRGIGDTVRKHILIHFGPARSEGCFLVAGGHPGWKRFRRLFEELLAQNPADTIEVFVEDRHTQLAANAA